MAEYIEREALYKEVTEKYHDINAGSYPFNIVAYDMAQLIKSAPAADVVEVVRCNDCEHRYVPCRCALWYGTNNGNEYFIERGDDFFCSYGKKKEGAEE
jgi:hypothetical protein